MIQDLDITEQVSVLRRCQIFANLSQETLSVLAEMMRLERFAPGETVCKAGEPAGEILVIADGELSVQLPLSSKPHRTVGPGDLIGEYGMFGQKVRTATITAKTDALLMALDYPRFRTFLIEFPESALALLEVAMERMIENIAAR
jgi:CRP-like cAMP-binding protein